MRIAQSGKQLASKLNNVTTKAGVVMLTGASAVALFATASVSANAPDALQNGANAAQPNGANGDLTGLFNTISNTLIYIVGAVAVVFLIIGGLRYVVSNGDPKAVEQAKNTILYAIIGIVVAILAFAIVNFVIGRF